MRNLPGIAKRMADDYSIQDACGSLRALWDPVTKLPSLGHIRFEDLAKFMKFKRGGSSTEEPIFCVSKHVRIFFKQKPRCMASHLVSSNAETNSYHRFGDHRVDGTMLLGMKYGRH